MPELNPVVEALVDADTTYEYWMRNAAMRYLREFDMPDNLYVRPQATVDTFHAQFPLPARLYSKWCKGIRIWPKMRSMQNLVLWQLLRQFLVCYLCLYINFVDSQTISLANIALILRPSFSTSFIKKEIS